MTFEIAVVNNTLPTSATTVDFTSGRITASPKLFIPFASSCLTLGAAASHIMYSQGATDGTTQGACSHRHQNVIGVTDIRSWADSTQSINLITGNANSIDGSAHHDSILSNGWRLDAGDAFSAAFRAAGLVVGGTSVSVDVVTVSAASGWTLDTERTISVSVGGTPDALIALGCHKDFQAGGPQVIGNANIGFASRLPSTVQACQAFSGATATGSVRQGYVLDNRILSMLGVVGASSVSVDASYELTAWGTNEVGITPRVAVVTDCSFVLVALRFTDDYEARAFSVATPTSTGTGNPIPVSGIVPEGGLIAGGMATSVGTPVANDDADCFMVGMWDDGLNERAITLMDDDGAGAPVAQSLMSDNAIRITNGVGTAEVVAEINAPTDGNINLNYTVATSARRIIGITFGAPAPSGRLTSGFDTGFNRIKTGFM